MGGVPQGLRMARGGVEHFERRLRYNAFRRDVMGDAKVRALPAGVHCRPSTRHAAAGCTEQAVRRAGPVL